MIKTDLIIIGSGPGGYHTAGYAAKKGLNVVIIEEHEAGGTCLNSGCIPTKSFCHDAETIETIKSAETSGISVNTPVIDFSKIVERKNNIVTQLRNGVESLMSAKGITFVRGKASFCDTHTIIVNNEKYSAPNIIIATGSYAKLPPIGGINTPGVITSSELLNINQVPKRLCIIGAGVIGMEFACAFNSFGSQVTMIEYFKECLPLLDSDIAKRLRKCLEKRGINFCMQSGVKCITKTDTGLSVTYVKKEQETCIEADVVLVATGRAANTDGMGLSEIGINYDNKGIVTDENMQTNIPGVYAIGDVNGKMMLAHAATFQGMRCVNHILSISDNIRLDIMPSAIFTTPEAGCVGLSEDVCKARGLEIICNKGFYRANGKALATNATEGMVKILSDTDGKVIGCHIYGAHAADLIQEMSSLMNKDVTIHELRNMVHIHPTLSELLFETVME